MLAVLRRICRQSCHKRRPYSTLHAGSGQPSIQAVVNQKWRQGSTPGTGSIPPHCRKTPHTRGSATPQTEAHLRRHNAKQPRSIHRSLFLLQPVRPQRVQRNMTQRRKAFSNPGSTSIGAMQHHVVGGIEIDQNVAVGGRRDPQLEVQHIALVSDFQLRTCRKARV